MMFLMSQDRPSSRDGSSKIINMNHVLMHSPSQMQYNNNNNLIINKNSFLSMESANNTNLLVHNKNMTAISSISTPPSIATSVSYMTSSVNGDEQQNGVNGNHQNHHQIVLLTNEKFDSTIDNEQLRSDDKKSPNGANDEELTSLSWLHDKNLLKGINLSCPKVQSPTDQVSNTSCLNVISKPSSEKDDSGVSIDNSFLQNSSSEQIEQHASPASPKPLNFTKSEFDSKNSVAETTNYNKNLDKSSHSIGNSSQVDIIKLVAGQNQHVRDHYQSSSLNSEESINQIIKTPQTHHQHFHKRYLRETLKQQDEEKKQQENQMRLENAQISSYIIAKPQLESNSRYLYDDQHIITAFHNNTDVGPQSNYDTNREYDLSQKVIDYAMPNKLNSSASSVASSTCSSPSPKQSKQHPNNIPYDPLVHTTSKPPYSFSSLIFMAIEDSMQKALPVKEIYAWIIQHFPYFKTAPTGWKNSVRHNLSLNKCFQKVEKAANLGKGSLWMVEPQYRPNLIQALTRSPFHPCSTWEKHAKNLIKPPSPESPNSKSNGSNRLPNPEHFPFLSKRLAAVMENYEDDVREQSRASTPSTNYEMPQNYSNGMPVYHNNNNSIVINGNIHNPELFARELNAETIDDVNAATAMLALKHGPKIFTEGISFNQPIVTTKSPNEDHTYSAFGKNGTDNNSNGTSSDAAYESSEESNVVYHFTQPLNDQEMEEQRRQAEGVDALLNLAGYNTNTTLLLKRPAADDQQFEKKQYFYTTEISPLSNNKAYMEACIDAPPLKKSKSRILRNKLKKKTWHR